MIANVKPNINVLFKLLKEFEGCKLQAYKDSGGVWTIGIGTTYLYDKSRKVQQEDLITDVQAMDYLSHDIYDTVKQLNHYIQKPLNDFQSSAIVSYTYNRGIGNFLKTQLDDFINLNPNDERIPNEIRGTGIKDRLGNILKGLQRRRKSEAILYQFGVLNFNP